MCAQSNGQCLKYSAVKQSQMMTDRISIDPVTAVTMALLVHSYNSHSTHCGTVVVHYYVQLTYIAGVHEPKEHRTQHARPSGSSRYTRVPNFTLYGKRPLRKSVKDKLVFVRYRKGLPYKV